MLFCLKTLWLVYFSSRKDSKYGSKYLLKRKKSKTSDRSHSWKKLQNCQIMSLENTPVTESILCLILLMWVAPLLNYSGQESKNNLHYMIVTYLWPSKKGQSSNLMWMLDPEQGCNHAKFKRPPLHHVHQKASVKGFVKSENVSVISLEYVGWGEQTNNKKKRWKIIIKIEVSIIY